MSDNAIRGSPRIACVMQPSTILVTGAAGFIGAHVAARLRTLGHTVVGCDNFNDYYAPALKAARVEALLGPLGVACERVELADPSAVRSLFDRLHPGIVVHVAAQAGVRYSLTHPEPYIQSNLVGFANILEASRQGSVDHLVYASSSSVYGECHEMPFRESQPTDSPVSLYAATKKANELMAHAYSHVHGLRATGLRFFTVYGPWGRPDMAYFSFAEKIRAGEALPVFAEGKLQRDFTYIDDIVEGVVRITLSARPDYAPAHEVFNIGNHTPVTVLEFIRTLSDLMGRQPEFRFLPMQPGDVPVTCADVDKLRARVGFQPSTPLRDGLARFVEWFDAWKTRTP
jgi:UDP-glucuronate 4-epimerase